MSNREIVILTKDRDINIVNENFKNLFKDNKPIILSEKYDSLSEATNKAINKAKEINPEVEFIHIFHDDLIINENFNIEKYETFMTEFNLGYYFNPRLNPLNYIYETLAPRLIIATEKYAEANINVYAYDAREHIIINCKKNTELFNEELKYLFNIEYIYRCNKTKIVPFLNFYFDSVAFINDVVRDDIHFPRKNIVKSEYAKEEQLLAEKHQVNWIPHSNADDIINYFKTIKGL